MDFCPVCGALGKIISTRCKRVARFYGYSSQDLFHLAAAGRSIAVPFFEINRLFFLLESLGCHPMKLPMLEAVERAEDLRKTGQRPLEFGNNVWVLAFSDPEFPDWTELYLKEDVSKTMVIYQQDGAIEHLGSEERAVVFAEVADCFFGLGSLVPPSACGLTPAGKKFVVSAGLSRDHYSSLEDCPRQDLPTLWREGLLPRITLLDFVLGQNDRSPQNILFTAGRNPGVGLIDNDDAFVTHARLVAPFAYLQGLDAEFDLRGAREWYSQFRLSDLVGHLAPLALPESIMLPLCRRFVFAQKAVSTGMSLQEFKQSVFIERPPLNWQLPDCPWTVYLPLVKEGKEGSFYRTIVGAWTGSDFVVDVVEGQLLDRTVTCRCVTKSGSSQEAEEEIARLILAALKDGFLHVIRRRLFVRVDEAAETDELRIVEVRGDPAGYHVIVRRGKLGYYENRPVERFVSFSSMSAAQACADTLENELLARNYADLRARLSSFKAGGPATFF